VADLPEHIVRGAHAADELRLELGLGVQPISDLWQLIRELGIDLAFHGFGSDKGDGIYFWDGSRGLVVVNSDREPLERQRFTAAHELGHHRLHRREGEPLVVAEGDLMAGGSKPVEEKEADAFAAYLLAPTEAMRSALPEKERHNLCAEDIVDLMRTYGTTYQTTVYRLHNSGRIYAPDRDRLLHESAGQVNVIREIKGFDKEELSPGNQLPPEYVLTALRMHHAGVVDLERLATLLRVPEEQAEELAAKESSETDAATSVEEALGFDLDAALAGDDG
jgi:Zn-dependent peptidase ImmA (M78 family)